MIRAGDTIEDHTGHIDPRRELGKALDQRCRTARLGAGIHNQQNLPIQNTGDFSGTADVTPPGGTVKKPHNAFDDGDVGILAALLESHLDRVLRAHPAVKIARGTTACPGVMARVDKIGADLKGGHLPPHTTQQAHQAEGNRGLAAATGRCGNDQGAQSVS